MSKKKYAGTRRWTAEEHEWREENKGLVIGDYLREFCLRFGRSDVTGAQLQNLRFRKGWPTGRNGPHNTRAPGDVFIHHGLVYVATDVLRRGSKTGLKLRLQHHVLWEKLHGPIPSGSMLKCRNGDRLSTDPSNWELIPRGLLFRLSGRGYCTAPAELKPTIMAVAKLEHKVREKDA